MYNKYLKCFIRKEYIKPNGENDWLMVNVAEPVKKKYSRSNMTLLLNEYDARTKQKRKNL